MNSDMVKREKFSHLHLVYHFTVPLRKQHLRKLNKTFKQNLRCNGDIIIVLQKKTMVW